MPQLNVRRRGQQPTPEFVQDFKAFQTLLGTLNSKDDLSWDLQHWTQKRHLKGDSVGGFYSQAEGLAEAPREPEEALLVGAGVATPTARVGVPNGRQTAILGPDVAHEFGPIRLAVDSRLNILEQQIANLGFEDRLAATASQMAADLRQDLQAQVGGVTQRIEAVLARDEEVRDLIDDQWGAIDKLVERLRPGTVQTLEQERDQLLKQMVALQDERRTQDLKLDALERDLRQYQTSTAQAERDQLEALRQDLETREAELINYHELKLSHADLSIQFEGLKRVQQTAMSHQEAYLVDEKLRSDYAKIQAENQELQVQVSLGEADRQALTSTRRKVQNLIGSLADAKRELQQARDEHADLREKQEAFDQQIQEYSENLVQLKKERSDLRLQSATTLAAERARIKADLERQQEDRFQAQQVVIDDLQRTNTQLNQDQSKLWDQNQALLKAEQKRLLEGNEVEALARLQSVKYQKLLSQNDELEKTLTDRRNEVAGLNPAYQVALDAAEKAHRKRLADLEAALETRRQEVEKERHDLLETGSTERQLVANLRGEKQGLAEAIVHLREDLDHLKAQREVIPDQQQRMQAIHEGVLEHRSTQDEAPEESLWLDEVGRKIQEAGFIYPRRLLEAFHTSLKIASWSPLTTLAGVSGTGKSELPRLYALHGGMNFLQVAVQPNWDSPQDLFGFFNYMDSRYRATEFLQALVQASTLEPYRDQMLVVLLDEMNLARVEQYFSEILSKLGSVRASGPGTGPRFKVDVGMGQTQPIELSPNVLYVGTMNEDETTHSLSDKVLDRGNVLTFPRPHRLESRNRQEASDLGLFPALPLAAWQSWIKEPFEVLNTPGTDVKIREALEEVNGALSMVNRAIGHRVLQAIEAYVANHPKTAEHAEGWKVAFGDQLAQRVMPKLKGLENNGHNERRCIERVGALLAELTPGLKADYDRARNHELTRNFRWDSAEYLHS